MSYAKVTYTKIYGKDEYEVLLDVSRGTERRLCVCAHEKDAIDIVAALEFAHKNGVV